MLKKITSFFLAAALCFTVWAIPVSAASLSKDIGIVTPFFLNYTSYCASGISITGTTAFCDSSAVGYSGETTKIYIEQTLQRRGTYGWVNEQTWTSTTYSYYASLSNYKYNLTSGTYRVKSFFKVYSGTNYDTITTYSSESTVS